MLQGVGRSSPARTVEDPLTDPRAQGHDTAPHDPGVAGSPPPSPWWSRPQEQQWDAPRETAPSSGQPPYGDYLSSPAADARAQAGPPQDPWSSPTTRATFPSGEQPWGTPVDTIGGPAR